MKTVEFRVIPVTRYIVTRYAKSEDGASNGPIGEFDNEAYASNVVLALGDSETLRADCPDKVITTRPNTPPGHEQTRTWKRGEGWDDAPEVAEQPKTPKIGDTVIFFQDTPKLGDEWHNGHRDHLAIVTAVWGPDCVNLKVLFDQGPIEDKSSVSRRTTPDDVSNPNEYWEWPE